MTAKEILEKLKSLGSESIKNTLLKHGASEPIYGVKIEELKKIQKVVKKDYKLSMELYNSGISDAMYLAGLIADESQMTKQDIQQWAEKATWQMISEYSVAWVASESKYGLALALEWIDSKKEKIASSGWAALGAIVSIKADDEDAIKLYKKLIERVAKQIHNAPNRVCYTMNAFIIAVGCYVPQLTDEAIATAKKIGPVVVDVGDTSCKVPYAVDYINKVKARGSLGKKKKTAKC